MPRPDPRTRILSVGVGATALVAALALAINPSTDVNPLGSLGRAEASSAPAAGTTAPQAFGVPGIDLQALGYSGPDLSATTLTQLNRPLADLPTERAADVRDRLGAATPHLRGLHQAKNLLSKAATKQDHHVHAAKVAAAAAEKARIAAEHALQEAIREATRPATPEVPADDERTDDDATGARTGAALASVAAVHGEPAESAESAGQAAKGGDGDAKAAGAARSSDAPTASPEPSGRGGEPAAKAQATEAKGKGSPGASGKGAATGGDEPSDKASDKASDKGAGSSPGKPAPKPAPEAAGTAHEGAGASGRAPEAGAPVDAGAAPGEGTTKRADADAATAGAATAGAPTAGGALTAQELVRQALEVERLAVEAAQARAEAAQQWRLLEARRERRRALRTAAEAAHAELARFDDHVRWLQQVLSRSQASMLSAGNWLVAEGRKAAELPIVEVRGFKVHASLEDSIRQLVDEAAAAGIDLKGKAYRPVSRQIELRRQNCGPSDYDIYEKPSSQCSPPTAKPGRSLHELGLAVDFRNGENSITSRSDPAFRWLARHAPSYGLYNLPAEPWHWSVTSQ